MEGMTDMDDDDHDTSNANTSQEAEESEFECENQDSEGPMDMLSVTTTKQAIKTGEDAQTTKDAKRMEKKREKVIKCIAAFFYEAGIPFNAVCQESFQLMLEAIGQFGPGLRGPSPEELRGPLLQEQVSAINDSIEVLKKSWAWEGCSIMLDTWTDIDGRRLMNLAVHCSQGLAFLRSIHLSSESHDDTYIFRLVDSCIEEVGEKNVVHVVTNIEANNMVAKMFTAKRPNIFWTQCAAHCIDLMLEDIGNIALIKNTVAKARSITAFIYGRTHLLDMMHQFTKQWDLVQIGITHSTTSYLNLKSLYDKRIELKAMFISKEWEDSKWSKEAVGKKFYNLVVSNKFWHRVLYAINIFEPLVDVLRRMRSGILSMGYIYGDLASAKKEIALRFGNKEKHYLPVWNIIDKRCDAKLKTPLQLAGYYLNPLFFYQNKQEIKSLQIFRDALVECTCSMYKDQSTQEKIANQLILYKTATESLRRELTIRQSTQMNLDPAVWWGLNGGPLKELRTMALRILRLTCGSLAWGRSSIETIHEKKPSHFTRKQFNDLTYVMVNLRLQERARRKDADPLVPYLPDDEEPYEWLVDMDENGDAQLETHKDEIRAILTPWPSRGDEGGPRHSNKKRKLSHVSCSEQGKKPQDVEIEEESSPEEEEEDGEEEDVGYWVESS